MFLKLPWLGPAAGLILGIVACEGFGLLVSFLAGLPCVLLAWARPMPFRDLSRCWGWSALGILLWWIEQTPLHPSDLRLEVWSDPLEVSMRGAVVGQPVVHSETRRGRVQERIRVELRVEEIDPEHQGWRPVFGRVWVQTQGRLPEGVYPGSFVEVHGLLGRPPIAAASGVFDLRRYLRRNGIHFILEAVPASGWRIPSEGEHPIPWAVRFLRWGQSALSEGIPSDATTGLLWAMALGWRAGLSRELTDLFARSGTLHVFAISGLHIALIAATLVTLLRVVRIDRRLLGCGAVPLLWFYAMATGGTSSALRSAVMTTVLMGGWALRRPGSAPNSLALAVVAIVLLDPGQVFDAGFQLSVSAVAGLMAGESLWSGGAWIEPWLQGDPFLPRELQPRWRPWVGTVARTLVRGFLLSVAATLASLPFTIHHFHRVSLVGPVANLLIIPISSLVLVACVASMLVHPLWPGLSGLFNAGAWLWMEIMVALSRWFAAWPGACWAVAAPPIAVWVLLIVAGVALLGAAPAPAVPARWWSRKPVWITVGSGVLAGVLVGMEGRGSTRVDVLRGGMIVIDAPGRSHDWVLNAGSDPSGGRLLIEWLRSRGWNRLPRLGILRADAGHAGGALLLFEEFRIVELWTGETRQRSPYFRGMLDEARRRGVSLRQADRTGDWGDWKVLSPVAGSKWTTAADNALVLAGTVESVRVVILPDLGPGAREELWRRWPAELETPELLITEVSPSNREAWERMVRRIRPRQVVVEDSGADRSGQRLRSRWHLDPSIRVHRVGDVEGIRVSRGRLEIESRAQDPWGLPVDGNPNGVPGGTAGVTRRATGRGGTGG
ncbi:MAG: putative hydrolase [Verrucomicrobiota bacterium]|jgi:competence protein ComEC